MSVLYAFALNPCFTELAEAVDRQGGGYASVAAVYNIAFGLGMVGGDVAADFLTAHASFLAALVAAAGVMLLSVPVLFLGRRPRPPSRQPAIQPHPHPREHPERVMTQPPSAADLSRTSTAACPASWFTDPAIVEREYERIFHRTWQYYFCRAEQYGQGGRLRRRHRRPDPVVAGPATRG